MWGYMYESSMHNAAETSDKPPALLSSEVEKYLEPRIEPEIVLCLKKRPSADMDEHSLLDCVDWIGTGFEIVQSPYPQWNFELPDTIACGGLHAGFYLGHTVKLANSPKQLLDWVNAFKTATLTLRCDGGFISSGLTNTVLGSPLLALKEILAVIENHPAAEDVQIQAGEMIATGTITDAFPVKPGQIWESSFGGDLPLEDTTITIV
jgi:2-oxo-3-hexenedioate decarboxylase